jgi:starvation-inducible DNA-binding protein
VSKNQKAVPELDTPTDMPPAAVDKISASLNTLLADAFALYVKTKNFHWHVSGRHFHDYHLLLDEQSDAIFATTDQLAERVRKLGGVTLRSIGEISKRQTIMDKQRGLRPAARDAARIDGGQQAHGGGASQGAQAVRRP